MSISNQKLMLRDFAEKHGMFQYEYYAVSYTHLQNFAMVMEMIAAAEVREDDADYQSPLDILFERLEMREPDTVSYTHLVPARERFCKHSVWISKRTFWGGAPNPVAYRWR